MTNQILYTDVDDRRGNQRLDDSARHVHHSSRRERECDRMRGPERRDRFDDVTPAAEDDEQAGEKQKVIVSREDVADAENEEAHERSAETARRWLERRRGFVGIGIDHSLHQVTLDGKLLQLTPTEYRLLTVLAARPDQVVPRDALAKLVWGDPDTGTSRTIDVHIGRLRVKLSQSGRLAPQIISVRGFGYKIVSSVRESGGDSLRTNSDGPARSLADGLIG